MNLAKLIKALKVKNMTTIDFGNKINYLNIARAVYRSIMQQRGPVGKFSLSSDFFENTPHHKRFFDCIYALGIEEGKRISELRQNEVTNEPVFSLEKQNLLIDEIFKILQIWGNLP